MDRIPTERITIYIDEDILEVARDEAEREGSSIGLVVSRLARSGFFAERPPVTYPEDLEPFHHRPGERIVTLNFVNRLRDELP